MEKVHISLDKSRLCSESVGNLEAPSRVLQTTAKLRQMLRGPLHL